jgi:hypothetical protein
VQVIVRFLKHKQVEYATLEREIAELRLEMQHATHQMSSTRQIAESHSNML